MRVAVVEEEERVRVVGTMLLQLDPVGGSLMEKRRRGKEDR